MKLNHGSDCVHPYSGNKTCVKPDGSVPKRLLELPGKFLPCSSRIQYFSSFCFGLLEKQTHCDACTNSRAEFYGRKNSKNTPAQAKNHQPLTTSKVYTARVSAATSERPVRHPTRPNGTPPPLDAPVGKKAPHGLQKSMWTPLSRLALRRCQN